jgi:hypothetical protein
MLFDFYWHTIDFCYCLKFGSYMHIRIAVDVYFLFWYLEIVFQFVKIEKYFELPFWIHVNHVYVCLLSFFFIHYYAQESHIAFGYSVFFSRLQYVLKVKAIHQGKVKFVNICSCMILKDITFICWGKNNKGIAMTMWLPRIQVIYLGHCTNLCISMLSYYLVCTNISSWKINLMKKICTN